MPGRRKGPDAPGGSIEHMPRASDGRETWERRWSSNEPASFHWHVDGPPEQLVKAIEGELLRRGAALDLGCGAGEASRYLAGTFHPAVGIDIAFEAVRYARAATRQHEGARPVFAVADATALPFASGRYSYVFDRGCLQSIPPQLWSRCLSEVERVLAPDGRFQLLVSKVAGSARGLARLRALARPRVGREVSKALSDDAILAAAPPALELMSIERFPFETANGQVRDFTHALFRKV